MPQPVISPQRYPSSFQKADHTTDPQRGPGRQFAVEALLAPPLGECVVLGEVLAVGLIEKPKVSGGGGPSELGAGRRDGLLHGGCQRGWGLVPVGEGRHRREEVRIPTEKKRIMIVKTFFKKTGKCGPRKGQVLR